MCWDVTRCHFIEDGDPFLVFRISVLIFSSANTLDFSVFQMLRTYIN